MASRSPPDRWPSLESTRCTPLCGAYPFGERERRNRAPGQATFLPHIAGGSTLRGGRRTQNGPKCVASLTHHPPPAPNFGELRACELRRIPLPKLFGKASGLGR